jgi:hypothetical protein
VLTCFQVIALSRMNPLSGKVASHAVSITCRFHRLQTRNLDASDGGGVVACGAEVVGSAQKRLVRVMQELSSLSTSLPVEYGAGIFLRVDEGRPDVIKAIITG